MILYPPVCVIIAVCNAGHPGEITAQGAARAAVGRAATSSWNERAREQKLPLSPCISDWAVELQMKSEERVLRLAAKKACAGLCSSLCWSSCGSWWGHTGVSATHPSLVTSADVVRVPCHIIQMVNEDVEQDWTVLTLAYSSSAWPPASPKSITCRKIWDP